MADLTIPPPPAPVGETRGNVHAKAGIPQSEAKRYNRTDIPGLGLRPNYGDLPDSASADERALASKVIQLFQDARNHRRPLIEDWRRWDAVMSNRTWMDGRASYLPSPEVPEIRPILSSLVAYLTDSRPGIELAPAMMPNTPQSAWWQQRCWDLQTVCDSVTHNQLSEREITKVAHDAYRYGAGVLKTTWDQALDGGLGNARIDRVNPYCFYPDPSASNTDDGNFYIEARDMSLQELDRRYPGSGTMMNAGVKQDIDEPDDGINNNFRTRTPRANPGAISGKGFDGHNAPPNPTGAWGREGAARDGLQNTDLTFADEVTLIECWMRTHQHVNPILDDQRQPTATVETWRVVAVVGQRVLLDADAKDLYGHPNHPYSRFVTEDEGTFWGTSMVEQLAPSQIQVNKGLASISHNLDLLGNPVLKESQRASVSRNAMTNKPGQRLLYGDGGEVDWLTPPPVHPLHLDMVNFYIQEMERISGYNSISRVQSGGGRNSTDVVNSMQEAGFVRVRLALRNLEYALRGVYTRLCDLIVRNYSAPRIVAFAPGSGTPTTIALAARHFQLPSENGATPLRAVVLVNAGSNRPVSKDAWKQEMDFLFTVGAIDRPALLETHGVPNWQIIDQRMSAMEQAGIAAQQQDAARTQTRA